MAYNNADTYEGATVWLLPYFPRSNAKSSYQLHLRSLEDTRRHQRTEGQKITLYSEAAHYLLSTYATSDVINDTGNAVRRY